MRNGKLMVAPTVLWLSFFFVVPLLIVVAVSFASRTPYGQVIFDWTLGNYARFTETLYLSIFLDTLIVALITTVLTILLGYPLAYFIAQLPQKWQQPGLILVMIPFWINFLIRSYAWVIILRTQGVLNTILAQFSAKSGILSHGDALVVHQDAGGGVLQLLGKLSHDGLLRFQDCCVRHCVFHLQRIIKTLFAHKDTNSVKRS